jgi:hypothetical protein
MTTSTVRMSDSQRRRLVKACLLLVCNATHLPIDGKRLTVAQQDRITSREDARGLINSILAEGQLFA